MIDPAKPTGQMARDRHLLVMQLLEDLVQSKVFTCKEIEEWAGNKTPEGHDLPTRSPNPCSNLLWAWNMACKTSGKPGALIRSFAALLRELFRAQNSVCGGVLVVGLE